MNSCFGRCVDRVEPKREEGQSRTCDQEIRGLSSRGKGEKMWNEKLRQKYWGCEIGVDLSDNAFWGAGGRVEKRK